MAPFPDTPRRRAIAAGAAAVLIALLVGLGAAGCGGSGESSDKTIYLVGYSAPASVYEKVIEPAFQETIAGEGVTFVNSFGPSVDQSRAVVTGQPASVVNFANRGDVERLVDAGVIPHEWKNIDAHKTAVAMIVRKGNPKELNTFQDLLSKDVKIIIPDPSSSGAGRWDLIALYEWAHYEDKSRQKTLDAVKAILEKTVVQPRSAVDARDAFLEGTGDVLLSYESDGVDANKEGKADYVVPPETILVDPPIVVTKNAPPVAEEFVLFIRSEAAQKLWATHGYRPIFTNMTGPTPNPQTPFFRFDEPGDWKTIEREFFDERTGSIAKIEKELGITNGG